MKSSSPSLTSQWVPHQSGLHKVAYKQCDMNLEFLWQKSRVSTCFFLLPITILLLMGLELFLICWMAPLQYFVSKSIWLTMMILNVLVRNDSKGLLENKCIVCPGKLAKGWYSWTLGMMIQFCPFGCGLAFNRWAISPAFVGYFCQPDTT